MSSLTYTSKKKIDNFKSQFGEQIFVQRTPIIELNSSYGLSQLRNIETVTNSGSISNGPGYIILSTGTTTNSISHLDSAEIGRYVPGYSAELGFGVRILTVPTGDSQYIIGGVDSSENNGFYFSYDSSGVSVVRLKNGVEENKIYQNQWNIDKLDGTGRSRELLNMTKGNIFQINFTWYGYGQITFGIIGQERRTGLNNQEFIPCHSLRVNDDISTASPNFRIHVESKNNSTTQDLICHVGGRQYSIIGKYIPKYRFTSDFRASTSTSTTITPLISFKRKTTDSDKSIKISGFDTIATTEPCVVQIFLNGTLTNDSFGTPTDATASETALESDISATAISGGILLWSSIVPASNNIKSATLSQNDFNLDIPNGSTISLCAKTLSGTGSIISTFRLKEEF